MVYDNYWSDGVAVQRLVERDGKPLTPEAQAKEDERVERGKDKHKEKAAKASAQQEDGENDKKKAETIPLSRLLELGTFSSPRREMVHGRPTIAVDFAGNPKAKTHTDDEKVVHELAGTIWLDEADQTVQHIEGRFISDFRFYGGFVASISKGTNFSFSKLRINDEIWLPDTQDVQGHMRLLLLLAGSIHMRTVNSDYRKLHVTTTILPAVKVVDEPDAAPETSPNPKPM